MRHWRIDNTDALTGLRAMAADSVPLVVTSPNYNLANSASAKGHPRASRGKHWANRGYDGCEDAEPEPVYQAGQLAVLTELARVLKPGGSICYIHKDRLDGGRMISPLEWLLKLPEPLVLRQQIVIDYGATWNHGGYYWAPEHEYMFWITSGVAHVKLADAALGSVWHLRRETEPAFPHPAPFCEAIPWRCINALSEPGDLVVDPFSGTGTTGRVALIKGRRYHGIEQSAHYCELSRIRLSQLVMPLALSEATP